MVEKEIMRLRKEGFRIAISDEREMLFETGGGLYKARGFFDDNPFLVYNVDIITDFDLKRLYRFHLEKKGLASLVVRKREGIRYFLVNSDGLLRGWCNKATGEKILAGGVDEELAEIAFSSMHIIEPEIFSYMTEGVYTMTALYLRLISEHKIYTLREDGGYWANVGTPEILDQVRKMLTPAVGGKKRDER